MWKQKTAAVVISAGMAAACLAFPCAAEEQELTVMPISGQVTEELAEPIAVNSLTREEGSLLPVRKIAEHFGYTVGWQEEGNIVTLTKGAQYITFAAGQDAYTFSKTAPQSLGAAPVIEADVTYVPVVFYTDFLGLNCHALENGEYSVVQPSRAEVTEMLEDGRIMVKDEHRGDVIVAVTEQTILTANGQVVSADLLEQGQTLRIEYGAAMTASLPPQGTAIQIEILNLPEEISEEAEAGVAFEGVISELPGEGKVMITPDGQDDPEQAICLMVSEETKITKGNDKRIYFIDDLTVGTKISGTHSQAMTMSIPPQTLALEIHIESQEEAVQEEQGVAFEGIISEVDESGKVLVLPEGAKDATEGICLIVSENTQITKGNDKRIYTLDDLTVGTKISGVHSNVMTRSLPPQTAAMEIKIEE
ncbi:MAG: stalk domain-containing protein [Clostridia bacterium]|nr:stalk domain-containing protein [Clostridia bacterium]